MVPLKLVTFLLFSLRIIQCNFELVNLISRIYNEGDSSSMTTVVFVGFSNNGFVRKFRTVNSNVPVAILSASSESYGNEQFYIGNVIFVVLCKDTSNEILSKLVKHIRVRKNVIAISDNMENLIKDFNFFHQNHFSRIFGIAGRNQYAFLPYSRSPIEAISKRKPLPNALVNLNGYSFRTAVQFDIPRVFWYLDKYGERQIAGYAGQLFKSFLRKHNATMIVIYLNSFDNQFGEIMKNRIDVKMVGLNGDNQVRLSYPLTRVGWTIMVPLNGYLNPNQYFLRPFALLSWICIGISFVFIVVMDVLKDRWTEQPVKVWKCIARTLLTILNMRSSDGITQAYRFHCQVIIFSFVLVNLYLVALTSFLTVFIEVRQFDTVKELVDNNVTMMVSTDGWEIILSHMPDAGLEKIMMKFDHATVLRARTSFTNANYSYAIDRDCAEFFLALHAKYSKPKFHLIRETSQESYVGFLQAQHSPFREILDNCIIQSMAAGLLQKWTSDAVGIVRQGQFDQDSLTGRVLTPLTLDHLRFAWIVLTAGLIIGFIIFLTERYLSCLFK